jgi:hypothetical protein
MDRGLTVTVVVSDCVLENDSERLLVSESVSERNVDAEGEPCVTVLDQLRDCDEDTSDDGDILPVTGCVTVTVRVLDAVDEIDLVADRVEVRL